MIAVEQLWTPYQVDKQVVTYSSYYSREWGGVTDRDVAFPGHSLDGANFVLAAIRQSSELQTYQDYVRNLPTAEALSYTNHLDMSAPEYPEQADVSGIVQKWGGYAPNSVDSTTVRYADNVITSAAIIETTHIQEKGRLASYISITHEPALGSDDSYINSYFTTGVSVADPLISKYSDRADVNAAAAESAQFLSLSEEQKYKYIHMTLDDRFKMLFVAEADRDQYLDSNQHYQTLSTGFTNVVSQDDPDVTGDEYKFIELGTSPVALDQIGQQLIDLGRDGIAEFNAEYAAYNQQILYPEINNDLDQLMRLYYATLGRSPDRDGMEYWLQEYKGGANLADIANSFAISGEFESVTGGGTADASVEALYQNVLGRASDADGKAFWLDKLANGETMAGVIIGFSESEEFKSNITYQVEAAKVNLWGSNMRDLVEQGTQLGFEQQELIGIPTDSQSFFISE